MISFKKFEPIKITKKEIIEEIAVKTKTVENILLNSALLFLYSEIYFTIPLNVPKTENCSKN